MGVDGGEPAGQLREALTRALAGHPEADRLTRAALQVRFEISDGSDAWTLRLDRRPPTLTDTDEPADVTLRIDPDAAASMASGRLSAAAALAAGAASADGPVRRYLEVEPILRGRLSPGGRGNWSPAVSAPIGVRACPGGRARLDPAWLAVDMRGVVKHFRGQAVLGGVDLQIPEGTISVLLGPSGGGKSLIVQHIVGLTQPDGGEVRVRGRVLGQLRRSELYDLRAEIGLMFPDGAPLSGMSLFDNVAFPLRQHTNLRDGEIAELVMRQLDRVGLASAAGHAPA